MIPSVTSQQILRVNDSAADTGELAPQQNSPANRSTSMSRTTQDGATAHTSTPRRPDGSTTKSFLPEVLNRKKWKVGGHYWFRDFEIGDTTWELVVWADISGGEPPYIEAIWSLGEKWVQLPLAALPESFLDAVQIACDLEWAYGGPHHGHEKDPDRDTYGE